MAFSWKKNADKDGNKPDKKAKKEKKKDTAPKVKKKKVKGPGQQGLVILFGGLIVGMCLAPIGYEAAYGKPDAMLNICFGTLSAVFVCATLVGIREESLKVTRLGPAPRAKTDDDKGPPDIGTDDDPDGKDPSGAPTEGGDNPPELAAELDFAADLGDEADPIELGENFGGGIEEVIEFKEED